MVYTMMVGTYSYKHIQYNDYSAMRGPCPNGYHIGNSTEWNNILKAGKDLGAWGISPSGGGTNFQTYVKIPKAGIRRVDNGAVGSSSGDGPGYVGVYWTCSAGEYASRINFTDSFVSLPGGDSKIVGANIRPVKDITVTPDNNWSMLYDGSSIASGAGIFHNASLGLISISSDGITWYTLSDKNLGATTVYNYGDTLTAANCGNFYQWGNNYGFARSGNVTTSQTGVDASNYGPGNYYSSSTFIISPSYQLDWSTVRNDNLRGGVTGVVTIDKRERVKKK